MKRLVFLLPILVIIYTSLPIFSADFFAIHDDQQVARIFLMKESLIAGQFPVRWVNHLGFGYGYPLFIFYPPLIYYLGAIFNLLGLSLILSVKMLIFLSFTLSAISMYLLLSRFYSRQISIISASVYILLPYRALDVYVRGALAEAFAFVFLPIVLLYSYQILIKQTRKNFILLALSFAGLVLTHTLTAISFLIILLGWIMAVFIWKKNFLGLAQLVVSLGIGGGISAFSSIPSILEKRFTLVDNILLTELADYRIHFVYIRQLWDSKWGYGGSLPELNDGMSFEIGKTIIILLGLLSTILLVKLFKKKKIYFFEIIPLLIIIPIIMMTRYSKLVWVIFPPLAFIQFPWRFLTYVTLFAPFIAASFSTQIRKKYLRLSSLILVIVLFLLILESLGKFQPNEFRKFSDKDYLSLERLDWATSRSSFEYIPKGVKTKISQDQTTIPDISEQNLPKTYAEFINGSGKIENLIFEPGNQKYKITAPDYVRIEFNTFDFPGWVAKINGEVVSINSQNNLRLITLDIPKGESIVELNFTRTRIRLISEIISIVCVIIIIGLSIISKLKNVKH